MTPARRLIVGLWIVAALVIIAAGFLGFDRWFYTHVSLVLNTEDRPLDRDFYAVTKPFWIMCRYAFGSLVAGLVLYVVAVVMQPKRWPTFTAALLSVAVAALLANVAQGAIGRLRPNQADSHLAFTKPFAQLLTKERVSFPSGEAATAFALAAVISRLFPRWRAAYYVAAALAGGARLVNGAHYPSDVVAGALFGAVVASMVFELLSRHEQKLLVRFRTP